ncbi:putative trafficking protein particle complex subunit 10 [Apostichopus japonicus]|uniref:Putative trafficking protein particle complex subunit 10 n=1 Tax=Stichopus japonicus TaxID=307972 RepID=A0A2G8JJV8_STIJA|nr:putative trafficking protein particle complex subunit 10 [Apostichopus japonicus]
MVKRGWDFVSYVHSVVCFNRQIYVSSCVTPADGKEICSTGALCNFTMNIESVDEPTADRRSLLYEIQTLGLWVMCGKNKGNVVVTADSKVTTVALEMLPLVSGFLPLPDVKFSEYPEDYQPETASTNPQEGSGDSSTEFDAEQMKITKIGHRRTPSEMALLPLDSNQVYYKSRATQVHVFPEFNASTVEVSLS